MTKVLALLTLAVLAFSAMTGPAFAPPAGVRVRTYEVSRLFQPFTDYRGRNGAGQSQLKEYVPQLFRPPGFVDEPFSPRR